MQIDAPMSQLTKRAVAQVQVVDRYSAGCTLVAFVHAGGLILTVRESRFAGDELAILPGLKLRGIQVDASLFLIREAVGQE